MKDWCNCNIYIVKWHKCHHYAHQSLQRLTTQIITLRRSFAEYWKHFVARFNDVHASGYNSAGSVRIRMKFGALRVYCPELAMTNFGRDLRRSESGTPSRNFVFFCPVNNARLCRFSVSQILRSLHTRHTSMSPWILWENIFENLPIWAYMNQISTKLSVQHTETVNNSLEINPSKQACRKLFRPCAYLYED